LSFTSRAGHKKSDFRLYIHDPKISRRCYILFLSGWLRKEGIVIESARKIVEGLADDGDKLYDRLATLEGTYSKAQMKSKGTKGCLKFLKLNLAAQTKPIKS
jgi:hypothetical protein